MMQRTSIRPQTTGAHYYRVRLTDVDLELLKTVLVHELGSHQGALRRLELERLLLRFTDCRPGRR